MSFDIMAFYVKVVLPKNKTNLLILLKDIDKTIEIFIANTLKELIANGQANLIEELEVYSKKKDVLCWNHRYPMNSKFIDIISKVQKIDGKEADVFELIFSDS